MRKKKVNTVEEKKEVISYSSISRSVKWRVGEAVLPPLQFKKEKKLVSFSLDDAQSVAMANGKGYPCSVLAFRLAHIAFRSLWNDIPVADDLEVISHLPPEAGSRAIFEFIARSVNVTYKGNWGEVTSGPSTFIFTNKATGLTLRIEVKESVFGGKEFFDLRNRVINNKATLEEGNLLSKYLQEALLNLLLKPDEELFRWTEVSSPERREM